MAVISTIWINSICRRKNDVPPISFIFSNSGQDVLKCFHPYNKTTMQRKSGTLVDIAVFCVVHDGWSSGSARFQCKLFNCPFVFYLDCAIQLGAGWLGNVASLRSSSHITFFLRQLNDFFLLFNCFCLFWCSPLDRSSFSHKKRFSYYTSFEEDT